MKEGTKSLLESGRLNGNCDGKRKILLMFLYEKLKNEQNCTFSKNRKNAEKYINQKTIRLPGLVTYKRLNLNSKNRKFGFFE